MAQLTGTEAATGPDTTVRGRGRAGGIGIHIIKRDSSSITVRAERGPFVIIVRAASCRHRIVNMGHAVCCPLVGELRRRRRRRRRSGTKSVKVRRGARKGPHRDARGDDGLESFLFIIFMTTFASPFGCC